jgi:hypothetical protein
VCDGEPTLMSGVQFPGLMYSRRELLQIVIDGCEAKIDAPEAHEWLPSNPDRFRFGRGKKIWTQDQQEEAESRADQPT